MCHHIHAYNRSIVIITFTDIIMNIFKAVMNIIRQHSCIISTVLSISQTVERRACL